MNKSQNFIVINNQLSNSFLTITFFIIAFETNKTITLGRKKREGGTTWKSRLNPAQ